MTRPIFTIGYERTDIGALAATLVDAGVTLVLDIREAPISRRPGFSKRQLADALGAAGIGYRHSRALGTPKPGRDAARSGDRQTFERIFQAHIRTPDAQAALAEAMDLARDETLCLLCYERDPAACHRSIVLDRLCAMGARPGRHLMVGPTVPGRQ
jgi:uncharacterized protein (DUF488 family)